MFTEVIGSVVRPRTRSILTVTGIMIPSDWTNCALRMSENPPLANETASRLRMLAVKFLSTWNQRGIRPRQKYFKVFAHLARVFLFTKHGWHLIIHSLTLVHVSIIEYTYNVLFFWLMTGWRRPWLAYNVWDGDRRMGATFEYICSTLELIPDLNERNEYVFDG